MKYTYRIEITEVTVPMPRVYRLPNGKLEVRMSTAKRIVSKVYARKVVR